MTMSISTGSESQGNTSRPQNPSRSLSIFPGSQQFVTTLSKPSIALCNPMHAPVHEGTRKKPDSSTSPQGKKNSRYLSRETGRRVTTAPPLPCQPFSPGPQSFLRAFWPQFLRMYGASVLGAGLLAVACHQPT